jgi:hypothetical protein
MLAGKYKSREELDKARGELAKTLGIAELVKSDYETNEQAAAAYKQLESLLGKRTKSPEEGEAPQLGEADAADPNAGYEVVLQRAGLDAAEITRQFMAEDKLTDAQYQDLWKKAGVPRGVVDQVLRQEKAAAIAEQTEIRNQLAGLSGGEQQLGTVMAWATSHYPANQHKTINARLRDPATSRDTMLGILHDHRQTVGGGSGKTMIDGDAGMTFPTNRPFADRKEYVQAKSAPQYRTDASYRKQVDARYIESLKAKTIV